MELKRQDKGPVRVPVPDYPPVTWDKKKPEPIGPIKEIKPGPGEKVKGK